VVALRRIRAEPQWSGLLRSSERDAGAAPSSASTLRDKPHAA